MSSKKITIIPTNLADSVYFPSYSVLPLMRPLGIDRLFRLVNLKGSKNLKLSKGLITNRRKLIKFRNCEQ